MPSLTHLVSLTRFQLTYPSRLLKFYLTHFNILSVKHNFVQQRTKNYFHMFQPQILKCSKCLGSQDSAPDPAWGANYSIPLTVGPLDFGENGGKG